MSGEIEKKVVDVDFVDLGQFVTIGRNFLRLSDDFPQELCGEVYKKLHALAGSMQWMIGDFFCQIANLRGSEVAKQLMDEWDVSYQRAAACRHVCDLIEVENRRSDLSFSHHEQALSVTDTIDEALDLLDIASDRGLSVAKMRQYAGRQNELPPAPTKSSPVRSIYEALKDVERLKRTTLDDSTRAQLKEDLKPMVEWYGTL